MCGIAGYVGGRNAPVVLFDMLRCLEYRGYDSAGIAYMEGGRIRIPKDKGRVDEVRAKLKPEALNSNIGFGHTRWATHGAPTQLNAHPHADCTGDFAVAHNGIIENHAELRVELEGRGHEFKSETDTEVIAHLLEDYYDGDLLDAFGRVLDRLKGSYALTVMSTHEPDRILVARNESPLIVGLGKGENYIASDAPAFIAHTREAVILGDMEYGLVTREKAEFYSLKSRTMIRKNPETITWDVKEAERAGYHHFMLKEIHEEPQAAANAVRDMEAIRTVAGRLAACRRLYFVACGTAYHAGLYAKYAAEAFGIQAEASIASEFRYSTVESVSDDCGVVVVSQSGETADTIAAAKEAARRGAYVAAVVNVVGSSLARCADDAVFTGSGPEIAVASTKAYIGQLVCLAAVVLELAKATMKADEKTYDAHISELRSLKPRMEEALKAARVRERAEEEANTHTFFFVGRRENYPTALEGALKLKEITYVHAEGYAAGELKHGPLAVMGKDVTVIAVVPEGPLRAKVESNIAEIRARGANVITVGHDGDFRVPKTLPAYAPILNVASLHLFAYYISVLKGLDPDKPRNLAKSVTVE